MKKFMLLKSLPWELPSPLNAFAMFTTSRKEYPLVCVGVSIPSVSPSGSGGDEDIDDYALGSSEDVTFDMVDFNKTTATLQSLAQRRSSLTSVASSTSSSTTTVTSHQNTANVIETHFDECLPGGDAAENGADAAAEGYGTIKAQPSVNGDSTSGGDYAFVRPSQVDPTLYPDITGITQLEDDETVVISYSNVVKFVGLDGRLLAWNGSGPSRSGAHTAELVFDFRVIGIVCLSDSILVFHSHGLQGRSYRDRGITQNLCDLSRCYRLCSVLDRGDDSTILLASYSGPTGETSLSPYEKQQEDTCDLHMVVGHDDKSKM